MSLSPTLTAPCLDFSQGFWTLDSGLQTCEAGPSPQGALSPVYLFSFFPCKQWHSVKTERGGGKDSGREGQGQQCLCPGEEGHFCSVS